MPRKSPDGEPPWQGMHWLLASAKKPCFTWERSEICSMRPSSSRAIRKAMNG